MYNAFIHMENNMKYFLILFLMLGINKVVLAEPSNSSKSVSTVEKAKCLDLGKKVIFEDKKLTIKDSEYWEKVCNKTKRDPKDK